MTEDGSYTQSRVPTAGKKRKFHSNLMVADLCIVKNVFGSISREEDFRRGMCKNPLRNPWCSVFGLRKLLVFYQVNL